MQNSTMILSPCIRVTSEAEGVIILRFENKDLYYNLDGVLNEITDFLKECRQDSKPDPFGLSVTSPKTVEE